MNFEPQPDVVAYEAGLVVQSSSAAGEMSSDSYNLLEPTTDDAQQQESLHMVDSNPQTLPERVLQDVAGMDTHSFDRIDAQTQGYGPYTDPLGATNYELSWDDSDWWTPLTHGYPDPQIVVGSHGLSSQDMPQSSLLPLPDGVETQFCLRDTATQSNEALSAGQFESPPLFSPRLSYPANMDVTDYVAPMRPELNQAGVPSGEPWMPPTTSIPIPHLQIDLPQSSSISPSHRSPRASHNGLSLMGNEEVGWLMDDQGQIFDPRESSVGASRRGSFLSVPDSLENVSDSAHSPTPSEISTPSGYSDPLPCSFVACQTQFSGIFRRGNQLRHMRLVHNAVEYPCGAQDCSSIFKRKDARLKHRRAHHRDEFPDLKPASKRKPWKSSQKQRRNQ